MTLCPFSGKVSHATFWSAQRQLRCIRQRLGRDCRRHTKPYRCEGCGLWHCGTRAAGAEEASR